MGDFFKSEIAAAQRAMIDFLRIDLDLAFTFLNSARNEAEDDPQHFQRAVARARKALGSIRELNGRIDDQTIRGEIRNRANELEAAIQAVCA